MRLSISKQGLQFLEEERKYQEIKTRIRKEEELEANQMSTPSSKSSRNHIRNSIKSRNRPNVDLSKISNNLKMRNSPPTFMSQRKPKFSYYTSPGYFAGERVKTEPERADQYEIFKDSLDSIRIKNRFLKNKVHKIVKKAKKKRKLNRIESRIKATGNSTTFGRFNTKVTSSLPYINANPHLKSQDGIISFNRSVAFFNKVQKKEKLDYKEFNEEIREIHKLKKLQISHNLLNKDFNSRIKNIKKVHEKIIAQKNNSHRGFSLCKQLRKSDGDFKQILKKKRGEENSAHQVFFIGDLSGGRNDKHQFSTGNLRLDKMEKRMLKGKFPGLPDVFRDEKLQNIKARGKKKKKRSRNETDANENYSSLMGNSVKFTDKKANPAGDKTYRKFVSVGGGLTSQKKRDIKIKEFSEN